jgi:CHAT domain-containing protein
VNDGSQIEILAVEGVAYAGLHQFAQAEKTLGQATQMCQSSLEATCGDVTRARGILAVQQGRIDDARQFFAQSLQFAHARGDRFLEITALLNLGLISLREEHFDEAVDWTDEAYKASTTFGANGEAEVALGNLGWAYYNLGDSEKSLKLSLEAEKLARQAGKDIDDLSWITNAGYVYASLGDPSHAEESYRKALELATGISGKEGIYNALRALALVSVESGKLDDARKYSDDAIAIARADNNRLDELYPLLVKGLVAAASHNPPEAERTFREVEQDAKANASLRWRAEHALARLYEDERQLDAADAEYRTALSTFETARSELKHEDSRLPFLTNASRIYDDYIHFLVAQDKKDKALQVAAFSRGRTLDEGLGLLPKVTSFKPDRLDAQGVALKTGSTVLFYWLGQQSSYLWAITPKKVSLFRLPAAAEIEAAAERYSKALQGSQDVLASANDDGLSLYRMLIAPARGMLPAGAQITILPDGKLNSLNFETLLVSDPKLHFWIEDVAITNASSLRLLAAPHFVKQRRSRSLLLFGNAVTASPEYPELDATVEMTAVAKHFPLAQQRVFQREQATPAAYLAGRPEQFSYIHFVAHGIDSRLSPLDSAIVLSKDSREKDSGEKENFKLYARDILQHSVRARLVTISACYGAGTRAYSGEGLAGLSWAFLRAGAHNVIAALWDASDVSTGQLMDKFYEELDKAESPATALRAAKLSLLHSSSLFRKPFYWAPFQLYTGY